MADKQPVASDERNESNVYLVRGQRVMLGMHLAEMHAVKPRTLDRVVERNIDRFPEGSVFQLNPEEVAGLKSQVAISDEAAPYVFTREGVAMLSSILFDERAIQDHRESCAPTCGCRK